MQFLKGNPACGAVMNTSGHLKDPVYQIKGHLAALLFSGPLSTGWLEHQSQRKRSLIPREGHS